MSSAKSNMTLVFPYIVNGMYWVQSITSKYQQVSEIEVFGVIFSWYGAIWSISLSFKYCLTFPTAILCEGVYFKQCSNLF